ncbi:Ankyrin-3 [Tetrabaena socialis]|uniref:Ankyrin-3 n=1 Tax=Tetrabaena socialis TaxID=47790 RepID=A0A2J8AI71_9CHLO|nr:Ankyrin-3 [Tetrabaena socialis]|eukprot:PNH12207.1 Ankyrin-3 [Tetrabaena socialis]
MHINIGHNTGANGDLELLLKKKAKLDAANKAKLTPLHVAAMSGVLGVLDVLIKAGAAVEAAPAGGASPLHCAVRACCGGALKASSLLNVADRLVAAGAALAAKDSEGLTPLMRLVASGRVAEALQLMERPSCGLEELDPSGRTVLTAEVAAEQPHLDLIRGLVAKGASVDMQLVMLLKPAALAALDLEFKTLVSAGLGKAAMTYVMRFDAEHAGDAAVDDSGNTHLHLVAESGASYEVVAALMSLGLSANKINREGDTPLHVAARGGHVEVCRGLVDGGADLLRRNAKNRTPRSQVKLPEASKQYLAEAEEAFKEVKEAKKSSLWDDKMRATQTESAFGTQAL